MKRMFFTCFLMICSISALLPIFGQDKEGIAAAERAKAKIIIRVLREGDELCLREGQQGAGIYVTGGGPVTTNVHNTAAASSSNITSVATELKNFSNQCIEGAGELCRRTSESIFEYVYAHKFKVALWGIAGSWTAITTRLLYLKYCLAKPEWWSRYKEAQSLEKLFTTPQEEFDEQLMFDIQQRYTTIGTIGDFAAPLVEFFRAVESEQSMLRSYQRISRFIIRMHLAKIFPINQTLLEEVPTRLDRLAYLKSRALSWISHHKLHRS